MIFKYRYIEPDITVQYGLMNLGIFKYLTLRQFHLTIIRFLMAGQNFGSGFFGGGFDSAVLITFDPIVAGMVKYRYL
ncbi:MAG: hypothetical protein BWX77_00926 [Bacteroidetes bacterium ADurb.Bin090]|nr:MAG: hypothetical protein BWX77_00926 [Bacteroidetes bacterium ADurb.Bin090]